MSPTSNLSSIVLLGVSNCPFVQHPLLAFEVDIGRKRNTVWFDVSGNEDIFELFLIQLRLCSCRVKSFRGLVSQWVREHWMVSTIIHLPFSISALVFSCFVVL